MCVCVYMINRLANPLECRYGKLIIEEGGVPPLLKLLKEGQLEAQENAARAIGLLGRDPESVEQIVNAGVCTVFGKILKEGDMKVQVVVAWAISELAAHHPKCQDHFAQSNVIRLLVRHLAFETIQEHSKYAITSKHNTNMSIHSVVVANDTENKNHNHHYPEKRKMHEDDDKRHASIPRPKGNQPSTQMHSVVANTLAMKKEMTHTAKPGHGNTHVPISGTSLKGRETVDPATKAQMKAMAARALWQLAKGNVSICHSITESRALLCFSVLLEKGPEDVQSYSAMALMEITAVAEQHSDLRRVAFKPNSPAAKAVVDQFLRIIEKADSDLLIPCIKSIGHLARTFRATETRIIAPLVRLLDEREPEVSMEATIALIKFACTENFLNETHCNAIIAAGGAKHLIQLVYFGEQMIQIPALILLCYVTMHVPKSETLAQEEVLIVLEWATKQAHMMQEPTIIDLLPEAKSRMELYQSRGTRGYH